MCTCVCLSIYLTASCLQMTTHRPCISIGDFVNVTSCHSCNKAYRSECTNVYLPIYVSASCLHTTTHCPCIYLVLYFVNVTSRHVTRAVWHIGRSAWCNQCIYQPMYWSAWCSSTNVYLSIYRSISQLSARNYLQLPAALSILLSPTIYPWTGQPIDRSICRQADVLSVRASQHTTW